MKNKRAAKKGAAAAQAQTHQAQPTQAQATQAQAILTQSTSTSTLNTTVQDSGSPSSIGSFLRAGKTLNAAAMPIPDGVGSIPSSLEQYTASSLGLNTATTATTLEQDSAAAQDLLSSQAAILVELRREQFEFEENVRQLHQQLQQRFMLPPLSPAEEDDEVDLDGHLGEAHENDLDDDDDLGDGDLEDDLDEDLEDDLEDYLEDDEDDDEENDDDEEDDDLEDEDEEEDADREYDDDEEDDISNESGSGYDEDTRLSGFHHSQQNNLSAQDLVSRPGTQWDTAATLGAESSASRAAGGQDDECFCGYPKGSPLCIRSECGIYMRSAVKNALATALASIPLIKMIDKYDISEQDAILLKTAAQQSKSQQNHNHHHHHKHNHNHTSTSSSARQNMGSALGATASAKSTEQLSTRANNATQGGSNQTPATSTSSSSSAGSAVAELGPAPPRPMTPAAMELPYKPLRSMTQYLEPVGETLEFQSAEGNSRQVLLHVWPPNPADSGMLDTLEDCCRDFQMQDVVRDHCGDGFLNGWRPSWIDPHASGILRFGHWRVRAPQGRDFEMFAPFQTPLTIAAGGGSVLGTMSNKHFIDNAQLPTVGKSNGTRRKSGGHDHHHHHHGHDHHHHHHNHTHSHHSHSGGSSSSSHSRQSEQNFSNSHEPGREDTTQGRLLRLIRAIQNVEKNIISRHLRYLFPTLYEKYHGLQFGTPRLFESVATVAMALDVSPKLHHDKAHTKHGFCWIVACGDFVGGDLCIPELGKRVVMRPGTVVAIRSAVVAYYVERYQKNTNMYTMYAYTADNCWPPAE